MAVEPTRLSIVLNVHATTRTPQSQVEAVRVNGFCKLQPDIWQLDARMPEINHEAEGSAASACTPTAGRADEQQAVASSGTRSLRS